MNYYDESDSALMEDVYQCAQNATDRHEFFRNLRAEQIAAREVREPQSQRLIDYMVRATPNDQWIRGRDLGEGMSLPEFQRMWDSYNRIPEWERPTEPGATPRGDRSGSSNAVLAIAGVIALAILALVLFFALSKTHDNSPSSPSSPSASSTSSTSPSSSSQEPSSSSQAPTPLTRTTTATQTQTQTQTATHTVTQTPSSTSSSPASSPASAPSQSSSSHGITIP